MAAQKNILLLIADDLGRDLSIYGHQTAYTPNLEKLAAQGTVFENAYASTASCSGSRSTIYTGLHTHQNGQFGLNKGYHRLHYFTTFDCIETHPKIFNRIGYSTQIINKLHVGPPKNYPFSVRDEAHCRDGKWLAERLESHIETCQSANKPFFTTIGFVDPHRDGTRWGFGNNKDQPGIEKRVYDPANVEIPDFLSDVPAVRHELSEYYQAIDRMDQGVGMLLDVLERKGVADSTLVVFLSDNGPPFVNSKATLYDNGIRLPMVVRCPGKKPATRNPNLISYTDLLPTFLDWSCNADIPSSNPLGTERIGRSLLPILDMEEDHNDFGHVFGSHTFHETSSYYPTRYLRTREYKYHRNIAWQLPFPFGADLYGAKSFEAMRNYQPNGPANVKMGKRPLRDLIHRPAEMLFDIVKDPNELVNLADDPKYENVLYEMRMRVEQWQRMTGDQWLYKDGVSLGLVDGHIRNGLKIPDRFDFDVNDPGTEGKVLVKKQDRILRRQSR